MPRPEAHAVWTASRGCARRPAQEVRTPCSGSVAQIVVGAAPGHMGEAPAQLLKGALGRFELLAFAGSRLKLVARTYEFANLLDEPVEICHRQPAGWKAARLEKALRPSVVAHATIVNAELDRSNPGKP